MVTFLVYGIDKWKAKQGSRRISEATLLLLAVIGGTIGALLGMQVWRHKTMHVFSSHFHEDHFTKEIIEWKKRREGNTYILSKDIYKHRRASLIDIL